MGDVINFTAAVNARLLSARITLAEQAEAERLQRRRATIHEDLADAGRPGAILANIVADVVDAKEKAAAPRFLPAYCDPSNESRGSKYEGTRDLSCKDIAARIRADIKEAIKAGRLPAGLKVRCYMPHYGSIEVRVIELPDGFPVLNPRFALWCQENGRPTGDSYGGPWDHSYRAYNRNNSDSMSDYFDVRYYGQPEIDSDLTRERTRSEIAAAHS
jgi:hypothetical protein